MIVARLYRRNSRSGAKLCLNGADFTVCGADFFKVERKIMNWSELARLRSEKIRDGAKFMFCGVKFFWVEGILEDLGE